MFNKAFPSLFYLQDFIYSLKGGDKKRIGFEFQGRAVSYHHVMASTRLRVYDVINAFRSSDKYHVELLKYWNQYAAVFFQKKFDRSAYQLAKRLKQKKSKIILDINVNYFDPSWMDISDLKQFEDVKKIIELCDYILVTTDYLKQYLHEHFHKQRVIVIEENIPEKFFKIPLRNFSNSETKIFVYNGYAIKAKEILLIQDTLNKLAKKYTIEYLFICEKNPEIHIPGITTKFVKYKEKINEYQLAKGHIYLAPRDLTNTYNLSHSFTKIGVPMAVGLPVVASPVPSYDRSPAVLVKNFDDAWYIEIKKILDDQDYYTNLSQQGRIYCQEHFLPTIIFNKYASFFESLMSSQ